jgi:colanic acid/amylovoran biosynthesis glycosyltransferase
MLGVVVKTVGRQSETYISRHIDGVCPKRTVVCSLAPCETPARWSPASPVFEVYRSRHRSVRLTRHVLQVANPARRENFDLARIGVWLVTNGVKVVLCEYLQMATTVGGVCRRLGIPVIAHAHGYDVSGQPRVEGWASVYAQELPQMAEIIVVSQFMKQRVLEYGVNPSQVHVVPCGAPVSAELEATRRRDCAKVKLVAVGRLVAKKGPMFLLEAFKQIRSAGVPAELMIIGDGPFREPMVQWIRSNQCADVVHLLGEVPNTVVRDHLRDADLFLQHSITAEDGDEEGLPVSILEAMAEGVPVVSTLHAGIPEVVRHGETGILVAPGDCRAMANSACELLRDGPLRQRMGAAGRSLLDAQFSLERQMGALRHIVAKYMNCEGGK